MTPTPPATPEALAAYLARIGYTGTPRPDLETLTALQRCQVHSIPFENFDVQLGRPLGRDPRAAWAKLVGARRGGWCFEANGLFAWMLEAIGFKVTRLAGAVMREQLGDEMIGNHLALAVHLDGRIYIAETGLGSGPVEPLALEEGPVVQGWKRLALERLDGGWWRFRNSPGLMPPSFDFSLEVTDEALLDDRCRWLQRDPGSPFVLNAIVQIHREGALEMIGGPVHTIFSAAGTTSRRLANAADYAATLRDRFGLALPEAERLWPKINAGPAPDIPAAA